MCIYEKFCCVIYNTIVNEECKYILNHNSDKFMYSLSYTPQKLKKKKHRNKVCPPDMYDRYPKLGSVIFAGKTSFSTKFLTPDISRKSQRTKAEPEQFFTKGMISQQVFFP